MIRHRCASTMLRACVPLALLCTVAAGCSSSMSVRSLLSGHRSSPPPSATPLPPATAPEPAPNLAPPVPISQGMQLDWNIKNAPEKPGLVRSGRAVVGPDGAVVLGPYGSCQVAGLPLDKARAMVEKQLAPYVKNASVALNVSTPAPIVPVAAKQPQPSSEGDVAWRPAGTPTTSVVAMSPAPATWKGPDPVQAAASWQNKDGPNLPMPPNGDKDKDKEKDKKDGKNAKDEGLPSLPAPQVMSSGPPVTVAPFDAAAVPLPGIPGPPPPPSELRLVTLPRYVIGVTDVLIIESLKGLETQRISGPHLVRPDGTVGLGIYGEVYLAGKTIDEARVLVSAKILERLNPERVKFKDVFDNLSLDVLAYNSKVYYVITDGAGFGDQVFRFPVTGNETVLDALSQINGLPAVASKHHIWVARRTPGHATLDHKLPVDWLGITRRGETKTNYQVFPGDRIYVQADKWRTADTVIAKILSPFERMLGVTLLGSQTVNSLRSGSVSGTGGGVSR